MVYANVFADFLQEECLICCMVTFYFLLFIAPQKLLFSTSGAMRQLPHQRKPKQQLSANYAPTTVLNLSYASAHLSASTGEYSTVFSLALTIFLASATFLIAPQAMS